MKQVRRWRYYCDHCKKASGTAHAMKIHELSCTNNPNRICRMCKAAGLEQKPIGELISSGGSGHVKQINKLRNAAQGCPACILSALRQGWASFFVEGDFNYKDEVKRFWEEIDGER